MSFRSRALLTGVATGFLKANNDRRDRMAERLQTLSDNRATMERERAKSRADAAAKEAAKEASEWHNLRSNEFIDDEGNFQKAYYDKAAYAEFIKPEVKERFGNDFNSFVAEWSKMQPKKFIRQYKDPNEIEASLQQVYSSIDTRQQAELQRPAFTGFDAMLGSMVNRVSSAVGGGNVFGPPSDGTLDSTPTPELNVMREQEQPTESTAPYEAPAFTQRTEPVKPETINQFIKGQDGKMYAVFADDTGKLVETELNIRVPEDAADAGPTSIGKMGTEKVRLFNPETGQFFMEDTHKDIATGAIRVGRDWVDVPEGMVTVPSDIKIDKIEFPDQVTGEVMTVQAYRNVTGGVGKNDITMADGTSWTPMTKPVPAVDNEGNRIQTKKPSPVLAANLADFNRQHKAITLVDELMRTNYKSNPTSWVKSNLSILADTVAASVGYEGNPNDLDAIISYIQNEASGTSLSEKIGTLDAEAVRKGEKNAIQEFLVFAIADAQKNGDRLSNQDVDNARAVVEPWIEGTVAHKGALLSARELSEKRVANIVAQDISQALGQGDTSPAWDYYRSTKMQIDKGNTPVAEVFDGKRLIDKIKALETTNPTAYAQTIKYITADRGLGPKWEDILKKPVRVDRETGVVFMPFYRENQDGTIRIGIYKAK